VGAFVSHTLVRGTLIKGLIVQALSEPFSKAAYIMFYDKPEIHPFRR
jgi:hypothetical protein